MLEARCGQEPVYGDTLFHVGCSISILLCATILRDERFGALPLKKDDISSGISETGNDAKVLSPLGARDTGS